MTAGMLPLTVGRAVYEWLCIILLFSGAAIGPIAFGAVRLWSFGGLAFICGVGSLLTFLLAFRSERSNWLIVPPGGFVWLIFLLYVLIRIPFSPIVYEARIEFLKMASLFAAYWAWMILLDRPKRWRILTSAVFLIGAGICLYAFIQQTRDPIKVWNIIVDYGRRARGTYICPNHFAAYLEILSCFALGVLLSKSSGWTLRLFAAYGLMSYLPAIYLTQSRSGWIGTFTGLSVVVLLLCWRKSSKLFFAMLGLIPVIVIVTSVVAWNTSPMVRERINAFLIPQSPESGKAFKVENSRLDFWKDTITMIKDAPVFGHGGGSYRHVFPRYITKIFPRYLRYAHNDYLHHIAEYGILGFILFGLIIIVGSIKYLKWIKRTERDKSACLAAGLMGALAATLAHCFFDYNWQYYSNNHVLVLIAAITASSFYGSGDFKAKKISRPVLLWIPIAVIVLIMTCSWIPMLLSYAYTLKGQDESERMELHKSIDSFQKALKCDPGNWNADMGLGQSYKSLGIWELNTELKDEFYAKSLKYYKKTLEGNPYEVAATYGMSQVVYKQGEREKALEMLEDATKKVPGFVFYKIRYGLALRKAGRHKDALAVFKDARKLQPSDSERRTIDLNIKFLRKKLR